MDIETRKLVYACYFPVVFIGMIWFVKLTEFLIGADFYTLGNYPLRIDHLYGVVLQPLLHENVSHLWSNTIPLFLLIWALFYFYGDISYKVFPLIWIGSGLVTWFIGRPSYHIGASGIVYGLVFFIFCSGLIRRVRHLMALSAIVAFIYGGLIWNLLPIVELWKPEMSWEGHLSGAIVGVILSVWFRKDPPQILPPDFGSVGEEHEDPYWMESESDGSSRI